MAKRKKSPAKKKKPKPKSGPDHEGYHLPVRTEEEQFEGLNEDLHDAWRSFKRFCSSLGRISSHTSHRSIMFYREKCFAFVRPKKTYLELNFFLPRALDHEQVSKVTAVSKTRWAHVVKVVHADQVEEPLTDWVRESYDHSA